MADNATIVKEVLGGVGERGHQRVPRHPRCTDRMALGRTQPLLAGKTFVGPQAVLEVSSRGSFKITLVSGLTSNGSLGLVIRRWYRSGIQTGESDQPGS